MQVEGSFLYSGPCGIGRELPNDSNKWEYISFPSVEIPPGTKIVDDSSLPIVGIFWPGVRSSLSELVDLLGLYSRSLRDVSVSGRSDFSFFAVGSDILPNCLGVLGGEDLLMLICCSFASIVRSLRVSDSSVGM